MPREPRPIAPINILNVIRQPAPQDIKKIDIDRSVASLEARQVPLQHLQQLTVQRLMLLQFRVIGVS